MSKTKLCIVLVMVLCFAIVVAITPAFVPGWGSGRVEALDTWSESQSGLTSYVWYALAVTPTPTPTTDRKVSQ